MFSSQFGFLKNSDIKTVTLRYSDPQNANKNLSISIAPELGSNMFSFKMGNYDLIYCDDNLLQDRDWTGCFVLWPLPNRVKGKQYEFEGRTVSLSEIKRKKGNEVLIHGLVDDKIWEFDAPVITEESASVKTRISITPEIQKYFPYSGSLTL